jgi:Glycosyl hydrolase catalytic core
MLLKRDIFNVLRKGLMTCAIALSMSASGGAAETAASGQSSAPPSISPRTGTRPVTKSAKRGIAYDLADPLDFAALAPGVSWWYNWSPKPNAQAPAGHVAQYQMDFYPMLWNDNYDATAVETYLLANPGIKYLLVVNEPNLVEQSNLTPQQAASIWPGFEAIAARTGVRIVGPAITSGTMPGYADPVVWLDAFYAAYRAANSNRDPQIDYLAFHWYDYGLNQQLERLTKYGKPFWVTEFANWHSQNDGTPIGSAAKQEAQMVDMVATCESRSDVFRYAWFTGRWDSDVHFTSLLAGAGELTELGRLYLSLSYTPP